MMGWKLTWYSLGEQPDVMQPVKLLSGTELRYQSVYFTGYPVSPTHGRGENDCELAPLSQTPQYASALFPPRTHQTLWLSVVFT